MPLVKVKDKYQVTLPAPVRERAGVAVGDLLEAAVEGKKITLTPKALADKELEWGLTRGLEDIKKGRVLGPFKTVKEAMRVLRARTR